MNFILSSAERVFMVVNSDKHTTACNLRDLRKAAQNSLLRHKQPTSTNTLRFYEMWNGKQERISLPQVNVLLQANKLKPIS